MVNFGWGPSRRAGGPAVSASYFECAFTNKRPNLANGGLHLPTTEGGLYQFGSPRTFPARRAETFGDVMGVGLSGPEKVLTQLPVTSRHASAQDLTPVLADPVGGKMHSLTYVDEVLE